MRRKTRMAVEFYRITLLVRFFTKWRKFVRIQSAAKLLVSRRKLAYFTFWLAAAKRAHSMRTSYLW